MGGVQDRQTSTHRIIDVAHQIGSRFRVDAAEAFVQNQNSRMACQGSGEQDSPQLAFGHFDDWAFAQVLKVHVVQQFLDPSTLIRPEWVLQKIRLMDARLHHLETGQRQLEAHQPVLRLWADQGHSFSHADRTAARFVTNQGKESRANPDIRPEFAAHEFQKRAFARAVRAGNQPAFAGMQFKRNLLEDRGVVQAQVHGLELDECLYGQLHNRILTRDR